MVMDRLAGEVPPERVVEMLEAGAQPLKDLIAALHTKLMVAELERRSCEPRLRREPALLPRACSRSASMSMQQRRARRSRRATRSASSSASRAPVAPGRGAAPGRGPASPSG